MIHALALHPLSPGALTARELASPRTLTPPPSARGHGAHSQRNADCHIAQAALKRSQRPREWHAAPVRQFLYSHRPQFRGRALLAAPHKGPKCVGFKVRRWGGRVAGPAWTVCRRHRRRSLRERVMKRSLHSKRSLHLRARPTPLRFADFPLRLAIDFPGSGLQALGGMRHLAAAALLLLALAAASARAGGNGVASGVQGDGLQTFSGE